MVPRNSTTVLKEGRKERTITFTRADHNLSLISLVQSEHREALCVAGPTPVNTTTTNKCTEEVPGRWHGQQAGTRVQGL